MSVNECREAGPWGALCGRPAGHTSDHHGLMEGGRHISWEQRPASPAPEPPSAGGLTAFERALLQDVKAQMPRAPLNPDHERSTLAVAQVDGMLSVIDRLLAERDALAAQVTMWRWLHWTAPDDASWVCACGVNGYGIEKCDACGAVNPKRQREADAAVQRTERDDAPKAGA